MFSARLPGDLVDQIAEAAEEEGVAQADVVEELLRDGFDRRQERERGGA